MTFSVMFHHHHMGCGPVPLAELPDVDDIAVEHYGLGFDALKVLKELGCMAPIGA